MGDKPSDLLQNIFLLVQNNIGRLDFFHRTLRTNEKFAIQFAH